MELNGSRTAVELQSDLSSNYRRNLPFSLAKLLYCIRCCTVRAYVNVVKIALAVAMTSPVLWFMRHVTIVTEFFLFFSCVCVHFCLVVKKLAETRVNDVVNKKILQKVSNIKQPSFGMDYLIH